MDAKHARELDLRGKVCPYVTADAHRALKELPARGELVVLTDYYPALTTLPYLAQDSGASTRTEQLGAGLWRIRSQKGG